MTACGATPKTRKILIIADLDYTHFDSSFRDDVVWLGGQEHWIQFYHELNSLMLSHNVQMHFAVVTNKDSFDDMAVEAALAFKPFLEVGHPSMFIPYEGRSWCLVDMSGHLQFECLDANKAVDCSSSRGFSNFVVAYLQAKAPYIKKIADAHGIPYDQCIIFDDTPCVLENARAEGIQTVGFEAFCAELIDVKKLSDAAYVQSVIAQKKLEIHRKIQTMLMSIDNVLSSETSVDSTPAVSDSTSSFLIQFKYDDDSTFIPAESAEPHDCLHSWNARFRLFGNR